MPCLHMYGLHGVRVMVHKCGTFAGRTSSSPILSCRLARNSKMQWLRECWWAALEWGSPKGGLAK